MHIFDLTAKCEKLLTSSASEMHGKDTTYILMNRDPVRNVKQLPLARRFLNYGSRPKGFKFGSRGAFP